MNGYIFLGDTYCQDCGDQACQDVRTYDDGDSDSYPQPVSFEWSEADTPQHCAYCGEFLCNPLTIDGRDYVARLHAEKPSELTAEWVDFYGIDDDEIARATGGAE